MINIKMEEVSNVSELAEQLSYIATQVNKGFTSGYHPYWEIVGEPEAPEAPEGSEE